MPDTNRTSVKPMMEQYERIRVIVKNWGSYSRITVISVEEIVDAESQLCGRVCAMNIAKGHTAASARCHVQLQLAALMRATALASADVQAMYLARMKAGEFGSMEPCFYTYYSYRYI